MLSIGAFCQNIDKISSRCPSPNRSIYGSILIGSNGNITYVPCPNGSNSYTGATTWNATTSPFGLFWRPSFPQLAVLDIVTPSILRIGTPYFTVGSNSVITQLQSTLMYGEGHFQGTAAFSTANGIVSTVNLSAGVGGGEVYGMQANASNDNDTSTLVRTIGIEAIASVSRPTTSDVVGGIFESFKGGSGSSTNGQFGIQSYSFCGHNNVTVTCVGGLFDTESLGNGVQSVTTMSPIRVTAITRGNTAVTDLRGIEFTAWAKNGGDTIVNSSAIYADTSIDIGATNNYFINSLSASPSRLAGSISITDNSKGLILKSPDNTCHLIAVSNANALSASTVTCP